MKSTRRLLFIEEANESGLELLAKQFRQPKPPIAFIGAGISARSGYPTWDRLISDLLDLMRGLEDDVLINPEAIKYSTDVLWKADACKAAFARKGRADLYLQALQKTFQTREESNTLLDLLVGLPFSHYLTTNYDPCIHEAYHRRHGKSLAVVDAGLSSDSSTSAMEVLSSLSKATSCVHLHGIYNNPKGIILTESDYRARYFNRSRDARLLAKFLEKNTVVFFGFSLDDADFMNVLRTIRGRLDSEPTVDEAPNFAFLPLSDTEQEARIISEKQRLSEKYRIRPIFFRRITQNYLGLDEAVRELVACVADSPLDTTPQRTVNGVGSNASEFKFDKSALNSPRYRDDPNKGAFGGLARRNGRELTASVKMDKEYPDWFNIDLCVTSLDPRHPLTDDGVFYVHPSFPKNKYKGRLVSPLRIERTFSAYGAFTVGVLVDANNTALELDLAELPDAPKVFRSR